jgi:uncharacterized protein (TIGR02598 family)
MSLRHAAFSLVETVIALGIFAFCIAVIMGLMPVGLNSARSVANEGNAVNIAESISAGWAMQQARGEPLQIPGILTNPPVPPLSVNSGDQFFFFDAQGRQVPDVSEASLRMRYRSSAASNSAAVDMTFFWPAAASDESAQSRSYNMVFQLPPPQP